MMQMVSNFDGKPQPQYKLDSLSGVKNYYNWILQEFEPFIGKRVLEVGAGIGTFSNILINLEKIETLFLVEPTHELMNILEKELGNNPKVTFIFSSAEDISGDYLRELNVDTVIFVNVLEHIENDFETIKRFSDGLKPGGKVLTFSPAFQVLYARIDSTAGHHRRYNKKGIKKILEAAGLNVVYLRYFNLLGFFSWLIFIKLLRSTEFSKGGLKLYDRLIPFMQKIENNIHPPFGQSIIAIGQKESAI